MYYRRQQRQLVGLALVACLVVFTLLPNFECDAATKDAYGDPGAVETFSRSPKFRGVRQTLPNMSSASRVPTIQTSQQLLFLKSLDNHQNNVKQRQSLQVQIQEQGHTIPPQALQQPQQPLDSKQQEKVGVPQQRNQQSTIQISLDIQRAVQTAKGEEVSPQAKPLNDITQASGAFDTNMKTLIRGCLNMDHMSFDNMGRTLDESFTSGQQRTLSWTCTHLLISKSASWDNLKGFSIVGQDSFSPSGRKTRKQQNLRSNESLLFLADFCGKFSLQWTSTDYDYTTLVPMIQYLTKNLPRVTKQFKEKGFDGIHIDLSRYFLSSFVPMQKNFTKGLSELREAIQRSIANRSSSGEGKTPFLISATFSWQFKEDFDVRDYLDVVFVSCGGVGDIFEDKDCPLYPKNPYSRDNTASNRETKQDNAQRSLVGLAEYFKNKGVPANRIAIDFLTNAADRRVFLTGPSYRNYTNPEKEEKMQLSRKLDLMRQNDYGGVFVSSWYIGGMFTTEATMTLINLLGKNFNKVEPWIQ